MRCGKGGNSACVREEPWLQIMTDTAADPLFHWQRCVKLLTLNFCPQKLLLCFSSQFSAGEASEEGEGGFQVQ